VIIEATPLDATQYTTQYELLRSQVIGASGAAARPDRAAQSRGVGLALLLGEGMPAWLRALDAVIRTSPDQRTIDAVQPPAPQRSAGCSITPPWLSDVLRHDITTLLTSLVLSTRRVEHCAPTEAHRSCQ
jgi:hypothetical protein